MTQFTYEYAMPSMTVDVVALRFAPTAQVLLIKRGAEPFKDFYALPGGFAGPDETVEEAAAREFAEETKIFRPFIHKNALVGVFSGPDRDPRGWVISAAYAIVVNEDEVAEADDDAAAVEWVAVKDLGSLDLAFDHAAVIEAGLRHFGLTFPR